MRTVILILILLGVLAAVFYYVSGSGADKVEVPNEVREESTSSVIAQSPYGYAFTYPSTYVVIEQDEAVKKDLVFVQSIFNKTDYEALTQSADPREAPVSLTVQVFKNPMNATVEEWITADSRSNYAQRTQDMKSTKLGTTEFTTYTIDGLYMTDVYVYGKDGYIYMFSNAWSDAQSQMKADMESVLASVTWSTPHIPAQVAHGDIKVTSPAVGGAIASPLVVEGVARGSWFFEASFPITLVNWDGLIIAEGYAQAEGDWMTEEFVPFKGEVVFTKPEYNERGAVILKKDNPSGLPEHDDAIEVPIIFN
jgi:hypothetical protein